MERSGVFTLLLRARGPFPGAPSMSPPTCSRSCPHGGPPVPRSWATLSISRVLVLRVVFSPKIPVLLLQPQDSSPAEYMDLIGDTYLS